MSWQKETPTTSGLYWAATRDGLLAGPFAVLCRPGNPTLTLVPGLSSNEQWEGWWWSEMIPRPDAEIPTWEDA